VLWENGTVTDLGTLPGGSFNEATAINNKGHIVGVAATPFAIHAVLWAKGSIFDLGTEGGLQSLAYDINDRGQIVGYRTVTEFGHSRAFLWEDGVMTDLGPLLGGGGFSPDSIAWALNNRGQVVGVSRSASGNTMPSCGRTAL
jgi:probable HAF family extracellular repeat protein